MHLEPSADDHIASSETSKVLQQFDGIFMNRWMLLHGRGKSTVLLETSHVSKHSHIANCCSVLADYLTLNENLYLPG